MLMILARTFVIWIILIVTEIFQGIARLRYLARRLGDRRSQQLGVCTGSVANFIIIAASIRWIGAASSNELLAVGSFLCILTFAFETLFGRLVAGYPWKRIFADFDPRQGGWLGFGFIAMLFSPMIAMRIF